MPWASMNCSSSFFFRAMPRRDLKPLAKALIARFGSFAEVVSARPERLREIEGLGDAAIIELKVIEAAAKRLTKSAIEKRPSLASFAAVVDYCRTAMAFLDHEEFRVVFLDNKNHLIADEVQGVGTVDHAPVYPREVMRRALELGASAIIVQGSRLVQGARLLLKQRQVMLRIEDELAATVDAGMAGDLVRAADDHHLVDVTHH
jgi:DNA repair protein RadC